MKPSKIVRVCAAMLLTITLGACGRQVGYDKENYAKAVQQYLGATDAVCVWSTPACAVRVCERSRLGAEQADQLVKVGLLAKEPATVRDFGQSLPGARYTLTDAGKKASRGVASGLGNRFCGGKAKLVDVDRAFSGRKGAGGR